MPRRARCNSKWNKILVVDDHHHEINSFQLDNLGQLENKLKTQKRRRIHEGRRARKAQNQRTESNQITNDNDNTHSHVFDERNFTLVNLQCSSEMNNNFINSLYFSNLSINDEETDNFHQFFINNSDEMFDSFDLNIPDINF